LRPWALMARCSPLGVAGLVNVFINVNVSANIARQHEQWTIWDSGGTRWMMW
jgi:hypothetical protein